jgi:hypothetical protein
MHINGQNGLMRQSAGGHGQADASSFLCYAYGQHLALDPGYLSYAQRDKVMNANNHNMILVNGSCGPSPGTPGATGDADAYIEKALDMPRLDYGKVTTAYCNTQITRHFLFIDNRYFLQSDFINSPTTQSFTWQLHGHGLENGNPTTGIFLRYFANSQATWQKQGVSLLAHITAQNQLTQIDTALKPHELSYNHPINHTVLLATKNGEKNTLFMACLYPYKNETPALIANLNDLPSGLTGIQTVNNGKKEQFYAQLSPNRRSLPPSATSLEDTAFLNAELTFISQTLSGDFLQAFIQNGSRLWVGSKKWMQSQKNLDMALQKLTDSTYYAYASQKDTLHFFMPQPVRSVFGANVLEWNYHCATQILSVTLNQGGAFSIFIGSPTLSPPTGNTEICAGASLRLEAPALPGIVYRWESPLGQRLEGNLLNIPQTWPEQSGNWQLKAFQNDCVIAEFNVSIRIKPGPRLSDLSSAISLCAGATLYLRSLGEEGAHYLWRSPDGLETMGWTLQRENLPLAAAGTWELWAEKEGCSRAQTFTIAVKPPPLWPTLSPFENVCQGQTVQLGFAPLPGVVYQWQGPGGFSVSSSSIVIPNISPSQAGAYTLHMQTADCQAPLQTTMLSVTTVAARFGGQDTSVCSGENARLVFELEGQAPWEIEVLPIGKITLGAEGQSGPIVLFYPLQSPQTATYTLVSVTDKNGCAAPASGERKVTATQPPANLTIEGNTSLCPGDNLALRANPYQVGATYL